MYFARKFGTAWVMLLVLALGIFGSDNAFAVGWTNTGSLNVERESHSATLLPSGKVLVVGGWNSNAGSLSSVELYDPATQSWSLPASVGVARYFHTATLLPSGNVLIVGGENSGGVLSSALMYYPSSNTWSYVASMHVARDLHTATLLPSGKVLVVGGEGASSVLSSAEIYDPAANTWTTVSSMSTPSYGHTATLRNGHVVVIGGRTAFGGATTSQIASFDPSTNSWYSPGITGARLTTARYLHTATLLSSGNILITGGDSGAATLSSAELFTADVGGNTTAVGNLSGPRRFHSATLLSSGKVLIAGGNSDSNGYGGALSSTDIFDPAGISWTSGGAMGVARTAHTATLLNSGKVLVAAGWGTSANVSSAELYDASAPNSRLVNIATRGPVFTGDNVMIGGFIIQGSTPKTVLVRARGPSMAAPPHNVPGTLSDPTLTLYSGSTPIANNDDWGDAANYLAISNTGLAPTDDLESAILTTLNPGAYTAIVAGFENDTGVGIVEVFEIDAPNTPMINIATRGQVLTGGNVMIGGFIIQGNSPQTVLVRARGPSMAEPPYNVPNTLPDPVLSLYSGASVIASNDDWGAASNASAINATGLAPGHYRESAILVTLNPGAYTAIVTGFASQTGVGIVEVFAR